MNNQDTTQTRADIESRVIAKAWKDESYKQELLNNPKVVIGKEFDVEFPDNVTIHVMTEDTNNLYFVIPNIPADISFQELSEEQLEAVAGGGTLDFVADTYDNLKDFGKEIYKAVVD